jgi:hypothetical protein
VEIEPQVDRDDEFEGELRQAFERRPAPPRLKRRVLEEARLRREAGSRRQIVFWQRFAAGTVLAAIVGGAAIWHAQEVRRHGEAARQQVMTALRITGHALNEVNARLSARDHGEE